jgi:hypothetical protein
MAKTIATITVNGKQREVVNRYSSGPGCEFHTYDLRGGQTVEQFGREWKLSSRGQFPRIVEVSR